MNNIREVLFYIMNGVDVIPFVGNYIIAIGAIIFRFAAGVAARDRLSAHTPVKFNLRFFIADNGARIVTYSLGLFFVLLFCSDIIGAKASLYVGFVIGLFIEDIVYKILSSRPEILNTFFNRGKQKIMEGYIWEIEFENTTDLVGYQTTSYDLASFAEASGGVLDGKIVTYESEPDYSTVTVTRLNSTTYLAGPVRKPTTPK